MWSDSVLSRPQIQIHTHRSKRCVHSENSSSVLMLCNQLQFASTREQRGRLHFKQKQEKIKTWRALILRKVQSDKLSQHHTHSAGPDRNIYRHQRNHSYSNPHTLQVLNILISEQTNLSLSFIISVWTSHTHPGDAQSLSSSLRSDGGAVFSSELFLVVFESRVSVPTVGGRGHSAGPGPGPGPGPAAAGGGENHQNLTSEIQWGGAE